MGKKYKKLFSKLCCSFCKNDIDRDAFTVVRKEKGANIVRMVCPKCGKDFGLGILKVHEGVAQPHEPLEVVQGAEPITYDEVLDIHEYLKNSPNMA